MGQTGMEEILILATKLDENGLHKEADTIDSLIKEAQFAWLKRLFKEPAFKQQYGTLRKAHQNLVAHFKTAHEELTNAGKYLGSAQGIAQVEEYQAFVRNIQVRLKAALESVGAGWNTAKDMRELMVKGKGQIEEMRGPEEAGKPGMGSESTETVKKLKGAGFSDAQIKTILELGVGRDPNKTEKIIPKT